MENILKNQKKLLLDLFYRKVLYLMWVGSQNFEHNVWTKSKGSY